MLQHEDLYWYQRVRKNWLKLGDRNTHFFHLDFMNRKRRNAIHYLVMNDGEEVHHPGQLKTIISHYFEGLFKDHFLEHELLLGGRFSTLSEEEFTMIEVRPLNEEIKAAIFSMRGLKSLRPDGINPIFFHAHWDTVGPLVCKQSRKLFQIQYLLLRSMRLILF